MTTWAKYALFPNATFYVQDAEMAFYTGRHASLGAFRHSIEVDDVLRARRLNMSADSHSWRLARDSCPASPCHHVGGHTAGMQIVTGAHARGQAWWLPTRLTTTATSLSASHSTPCTTCRACTRLSRRSGAASSEDMVLPGHDPLVLERLTKVGDGIVEL